MVRKATVSQYVEGYFPVGKDELLNRAKEGSAPDTVIEALCKLPEREFNDINDLWEAVIK